MAIPYPKTKADAIWCLKLIDEQLRFLNQAKNLLTGYEELALVLEAFPGIENENGEIVK